MLETPSIAERAAILHIMCLDNDKFDALFAGQHGKAALLVFEDRLPHYLEASGRRPYAVADYFRDISEFSVQDIHADEAYLDSAKRLTADFTQATIEYIGAKCCKGLRFSARELAFLLCAASRQRVG